MNVNQKENQYKTRKRNRLKDYDYSESGYYYVTICSRDKKNIFGDIVGDGLAPSRPELSQLGQIIEKQWNDIPKQYDDIELDEYVIMPNHIHGILIINKRTGARTITRTGASPVPTVSISNIIGSFKSKTSREYLQYIKKNNLKISGQIWQRSFYDHVIRNDKSLNEIREYIVNNPAVWDHDEDNLINCSIKK